jgi:hypothetical protein
LDRAAGTCQIKVDELGWKFIGEEYLRDKLFTADPKESVYIGGTNCDADIGKDAQLTSQLIATNFAVLSHLRTKPTQFTPICRETEILGFISHY